MIAIRTGRSTKNCKPEYRFLSSVKNFVLDRDHDFRERGNLSVGVDPAWYPSDWKEYQVDLSTGELLGVSHRQDAVILPCGQCLGCRTAYAAHWADRILMEAQYFDETYFLTLTYDPEHVPRHLSKDGNEVLSLEPRDLQLFLKRLRWQQAQDFGNRIRFYAVGEYGDLHHRPHYHLIVFGLKLFDVKESGKNKQGHVLHDSETINELWGKGITEVEPLNWKMAAYCARYTVKKLGKVETGFYRDQNLVPEFSRMSLKPAIGAAYFDDHHKRIYKSDRISIPSGDGVRKVQPPKYFDKLYDDVYPADMERVKGNRKKIAQEQLKLRLMNFSGNYLELLAAEEAAFKARTKSLRRTLE